MMFPKAFHFLKTHKLLYTGTLAILVFVVLGMVGSSLIKKDPIDDVSFFSFSMSGLLLTGVFAYGIGLMIWLWMVQRKTFKPTKKLIQTGKKLILEDLSNLVTAISELSQGNLSKQMSYDMKHLSKTKQTEINGIIDIFNSMIGNLNDAAIAYNNVTNIPCKHFCYVGADSFLEGRRCGELFGKYLNNSGRILLVSENLKASNLDLRGRGCKSMLHEKYPDIKIVDTIELGTNREKSFKVIKDELKKYPQINGIYILDGASPPIVAQVIEELNKSKRIKIIAHDLTDETMKYLIKGVITATLSQDPYSQGYNPVIHLYNHLTTDWKPVTPYLLTNMDVVTVDNYKEFWQESKGIIFSEHTYERLATPLVEKSEKPLCIAVLGREDNKFWYPVRDGVLDAAKKLASCNVTVKWVAIEKEKDVQDISEGIYQTMIDKLIKEGCNGFACVVNNKELIPYINQSVEQGIPVALYNSDPTSLRGLIYTITNLAVNLLGLSEDLASNTYETSQATVQIKDAMSNVEEETKSQNDQVTKTGDALKDLLNTIDNVSMDAKQSAKTTEDTVKAVDASTEAMNKTLSTIQVIEESVSNTWNIVGELEKHSERIDTVVDLINDIASRVNVLALNAAIEATKAGEYGKGFMVVANEIRNLAKNTAEATREVAELINTVQSDIVQVEKVMTDGLGKVKNTITMTDKAMKGLDDIQKRVKIDKRRIQNIAQAMNNMQKSSHLVGEAMNHVAKASEKNIIVVEQVNSLTIEMTSQLEIVSELARSLESMAQGEQKMLAKFNVMQST